jgi:hypothetical protein
MNTTYKSHYYHLGLDIVPLCRDILMYIRVYINP